MTLLDYGKIVQDGAMYHIDRHFPQILPDPPFALHVAGVGRFRSSGRFRWEQVAPHDVLHCIRAGDGVFEEDGQKIRAGPGDMILFRRGRHYRYWDSTPWRYDFVTFGGALEPALDRILPATQPVAQRSHGPAWRVLDALVARWTVRSIGASEAAMWAWRLLHRLAAPIDAPPPETDLGARLIAALSSGASEFPTVDQLARQFGVDRSTLYRHVRRETGQSVKHWIDLARFRRARDLLTVSDAPVREVARLCGFRDPLYFSRAFRARFGAPPGAWRQTRRKHKV